MSDQRGFTLVEAAIVAGILALLAAGAAFALGTKPYALRSSLTLLDASLAQARTLAEASGNAATVVVTPHGSGATLSLYSGRPENPAEMHAAGPPIELDVSVSERSLGPPPFTLVIDASGHGAPASCLPPGYRLSISSGSVSEYRDLPCAPDAPSAPDTVPSP